MKFYFYQAWIVGFAVVIAVVENSQPDFDSQTVNVTVIAGTTAVLPCVVMNIGKYEVVWMSPKKILISKNDQRLLDDKRMSIERPDIPYWNLHVREVRYDDRGLYVCNLNTNPMQNKYFNLIVKVIPDINEKWSSGNKIAKEGDTVELHCNATGVPQPIIQWFRKSNGKKDSLGRPGEILVIHNISRHCDGIYECIADNGVGQAASKEINVSVQFPPEIRLLTKRLGHSMGKETILACVIAASPQAEIYWKKGNKIIKTASGKSRADVFQDSAYTLTLYLQILDLQKEDFGNYTCEASNRLGKDSETMILYEYADSRNKPLPSTAEKGVVVYNNPTRKPNINMYMPNPDVPNESPISWGNNGSERPIAPSVLLFCAIAMTMFVILIRTSS